MLDGFSAYRLRGAVLLSAPLNFKIAMSERLETLDRYWPASLVSESPCRSQELFCPNGLLNSLKNGGGTGDIARAADLGIPDLLVLLGEFDLEGETVKPGMRFIDLWKEGFGGANGVEFVWIRGHNLISRHWR